MYLYKLVSVTSLAFKAKNELMIISQDELERENMMSNF